MAASRSCAHVELSWGIIIVLPWYFIPRVLKLAKAEMYIRSGYDGDSGTVNVLARHTALKR